MTLKAPNYDQLQAKKSKLAMSLESLSQSSSRSLPPVSLYVPYDGLEHIRSPEPFPNRTDELKERIQSAGWDELQIEEYLLKYKHSLELLELRLKYRPESLEAIRRFCNDLLSIPDSRTEEYIIYPLYLVILLAFLASLHGFNDCAGVAQFCRIYNPFLQALIPCFPPPDRIISPDRVRYCLESCQPDALHNIFFDYFTKVTIEADELIDYQSGFLHGAVDPFFRTAQPKQRLETIGGDGQTAQGAMRKGLFTRACKGVEISSLNLCSHQVTLDYEITGKKNQETEAFTRMLLRLNKKLGRLFTKLTGAVFMCDALNTRTSLTKTLLSLGLNFLLPVKRNAGNKQMFEQCETAFKHASFEDVADKLKPQTFKVVEHGRHESYIISILPIDAIEDPSANKHPGVKCIVRKVKVSQRLIKRAPLTDADAKRREDSIKQGAMDGKPTTTYYICSLPYCLDTFLQVLDSISCYWAGVEAMHGKLDRYAGNQDAIRGCSDLNYLPNRIAINKMLLPIWSHLRQIETRKKYAQSSYHPRKLDASKVPVSFHYVQRTMHDPLNLLDGLSSYLLANCLLAG